jgi:hypothetical protein
MTLMLPLDNLRILAHNWCFDHAVEAVPDDAFLLHIARVQTASTTHQILRCLELMDTGHSVQPLLKRWLETYAYPVADIHTPISKEEKCPRKSG